MAYIYIAKKQQYNYTTMSGKAVSLYLDIFIIFVPADQMGSLGCRLTAWLIMWPLDVTPDWSPALLYDLLVTLSGHGRWAGGSCLSPDLIHVDQACYDSIEIYISHYLWSPLYMHISCKRESREFSMVCWKTMANKHAPIFLYISLCLSSY